MGKQQLMKSAFVSVLAVLFACGLWVIAGKAGVNISGQNSNQNSNANSSANANKAQNRNANKSKNPGATGEQAGMANLSSQDRDFLMDAAMGGMMEVELGHVAAQKGSSDAVKQFGQRMVDDHSKANEELMSVASSKGITLPTTLDEKHREHVTKLSSLSGAEFDRAYSKMMLSDHTKDAAAFEKEGNKGADAELKAFAAKTLPVIQEHLQMAKTLPGNQRANTNSNSNSNRP